MLPDRLDGASALVVLAVTFLLFPQADVEAQQYSSDLYSSLEWTNVGPDRGGRSTAVAGSASRPYEYYFGATGGGLWKTSDGGQTWSPITDGQLGSASVGAVQVCEANPDIIYIGMGETEIRGNIQQGDGIYRSDDAGKTWTHLGMAATQNISRIRVHPTDCDVAWAAAFGVHSAPNPERGVYKTSDGGASWERVLFRDERSGAVDLVLDANNPDVLYASLWEAWRKSWGMSSGGPGTGLFKSTDGGATWSEISRNPGLPQEGLLGKIGVAVSPANSQRVWAIMEHQEGGVFRSDDGGATWTRTNDERKLRQRAFYYTRIYADPQDEDQVYVLNTAFFRSTDGGETFPRAIRVPHGDNHDLWISPDDPLRMINANDGGGNVSVNGGESWTDQDYATAQFYRVVTTEHFPYHICGAQQDNSTVCVPSGGWGHLSGGGNYFYTVGGCESGYIAPNPENTDVFFAGCYGGSLSRYDHGNGQTRAVNVWPENPMGQSAEDLKERVQWTFPIIYSPVDPSVLYTGTQKVWKTTNEGQTWEALSPDLTRADPMTIGPSGGMITKDQTGVETYATVFAIAPSPHDVNVIWAGSDDGYVHVTRDGGATWDRVTPPDAPDFVRINTIEASPHAPGKAYVSGIRYLVDNDRSPYVWKTEDYGATWTKIVNGIPSDDFIRATREDPKRAGLLYAASERTVYVSWNDGADWQPLAMNLPVVQVSDLVVEDEDLVIGTHGRAFWVMRNIGPLRQMGPAVASAAVHLFDPADPVRGVDRGVSVDYYLAEGATKVTLEFLDARGDVIQSYEASAEDEDEEEGGGGGGGGGFFGGGGAPRVSVESGAHRVTWNLRYPGFTGFDGMIMWAAGNVGPMAVPGTYQVRLTVNDASPQVQDFEVRLDPRIDDVTLAQLQERFDFSMRVRDRVTNANQAVLDIRGIKTEVDDRLGRTDDTEIQAVGTEVNEKLSGVEGEIYQVQNQSNQDPLNFPIKLNNKLAALMGIVERGENPPTDQSYDVFTALSQALDVQIGQMQVIIQQDVGRLNQLLRAAGLPEIQTSNLISD